MENYKWKCVNHRELISWEEDFKIRKCGERKLLQDFDKGRIM
jgi:hypothetical protein